MTISERGSGAEHEASRRCKAELLVQLDGLETEREGSILFLASTNLPWTIDQAIMRRFSKKILVELPDEEERLSIIRSSAANRLIGEVVQSRRRPLLGPSPS